MLLNEFGQHALKERPFMASPLLRRFLAAVLLAAEVPSSCQSSWFKEVPQSRQRGAVILS